MFKDEIRLSGTALHTGMLTDTSISTFKSQSMIGKFQSHIAGKTLNNPINIFNDPILSRNYNYDDGLKFLQTLNKDIHVDSRNVAALEIKVNEVRPTVL